MKYFFLVICFFQTSHVFASAKGNDVPTILGRLVGYIQQAIRSSSEVLPFIGLCLFILGFTYLKNQKKNNYPIHYILVTIVVGLSLIQPMGCASILSRGVTGDKSSMEKRLDDIETNNAEATDFNFNGE